MRRLATPLLCLHVVSLCLWGAAVLGSGLAAAIAFPTMKALDPHLPAYSAYEGDHWMLAAGKIANRVFEITDAVQMAMAALAVFTAVGLLVARVCRVRSIAGAMWLACVAAAVGVLAYTLLTLRPAMAVDLHAYWDAALAGDTPTAESAREAFSAEHPTASNLMAATSACVLGALVLVVPAAGIGKRAAVTSVATGGDASGSV